MKGSGRGALADSRTRVVPSGGGAGRPSSRAGRLAALLVAVVVAIAVVFLAVIDPVTPPGWPAVGMQALASALTVLAALLLGPRHMRWGRPAGAVLAVSALFLVAAVAYVAVAGRPNPASVLPGAAAACLAGISEEFVFRGALWSRLVEVLPNKVVVLLVDVAAFVLFHVPLVVLHHEGVLALAPIAGFGLVFGLARLISRGIVLPAALHVAVDLSSLA